MEGDRTVASNRRARHDYDIEETFEAGIVLTGPEVKSLRGGRASLSDAYARVDGPAVWLENMHIPPYEQQMDKSQYPAALSFLMMAVILAMVIVYIRIAGTEAFIGEEEEAKT